MVTTRPTFAHCFLPDGIVFARTSLVYEIFPLGRAEVVLSRICSVLP
jgi:hypothetical protein